MKQWWNEVHKSVKKGSVLEGELLVKKVSPDVQSSKTKLDCFDIDSSSSFPWMEKSRSDIVNLAKLGRKNVPLVLNFGSCS